MTLSEIVIPSFLQRKCQERCPHGDGVDPLSDVGCGNEELGSIPCVLIPSGFNDQPLSSLHEEVRRTPVQMTMLPKSGLRRTFIGPISFLSILTPGRANGYDSSPYAWSGPAEVPRATRTGHEE